VSDKISACLLVRDDASTLKVCLESIRPHVDELVILDTGSTDDSPAIAKEYADKWARWTDCNDEAGLIADFAAARNRSYELASHDWVFWADADDEFVGGEHLRELAAKRPTENVMYLVPYEYQHDAAGRVTVYHYRENLAYPRQSYRWRVPVHEVMVPEGPIVGSTATAYVHDVLPGRDIRRVHRKQHSTKPPDPMRNWRILDRYVRANGEGDVRALYYLGVECSTLGMPGQALSNLRRYVQLTDSPSGWTDERCLATLEIARVHEKIGDWEQAIEWGLRAMATKSWCEPYFVVARGCMALAELGKNVTYNYKRAARFAQDGLKLSKTNTVLFVNPMERYEIHRVLNVALYKLGDLPSALQSCRDGLEGLPGDPELTNNLAVFDGAVTRNRVLGDLTRLYEIGQLAPDWCNALASRLAGAAQQMAAAPALPPAPVALPPCPVPAQTAAEGCLDIALFVGPQFEPWNPETLAATGMGGSEVMAWEMSKRLRALGHRVRVFGHCNPEHEGLFDGVEWLAWERFQGSTCDVLIASRRPEAVDPGVCDAKVRLLWLHDIHVGDALDYRRALATDAVLALSNWHRATLLQIYPGLDPSKVVVTRNGIDYGRFDLGASFATEGPYSLPEMQKQYPGEPIQDLWARVPGGIELIIRHPHRLVYSSSPDRGLHILLELWPQIRAEIPDAELRVLYGFDNLEKAAAARQDPRELALVAKLKEGLKQEGIVNRGRVSPSDLALTFLSAGVWAAPSWFSETFCISCVEAMAAGLHIVTTPVAALKEVALPPAVLVPGVIEDPYAAQTPEFLAEFFHQTIQAMRRAEVGPAEYQRPYGLDELAKEWDEMLRGLVETVPGTCPRFAA
jgi:glycosyltransferase involved in cell wall biosynthesis